MTVAELGERMSAAEFGMWIAELRIRGELQDPAAASPDPVSFFNNLGGVH